MKNKLEDLNNHLFAQIERLSDEDITGEKLTEEIERSKAVSSVADRIVGNAALVLRAHTVVNSGHVKSLPKMIGIKPEDE